MKKIKFWILIISMVLLTVADGFLTYINTPDLSMERNPLVAKFGLGWGALAIANIVSLAICFIISYYSYFKYKTVYTNETKFTSYCSQIGYNRPDMFWKGILPKHITPYIAAMGYAITYMWIFSRAVLVFEWIYITFNENWWTAPYFIFVDKYCFGYLDLFGAVVIGVIGMFYWFYKEFKKQLKK